MGHVLIDFFFFFLSPFLLFPLIMYAHSLVLPLTSAVHKIRLPSTVCKLVMDDDLDEGKE